MEQEFWRERWRKQELGFHRADVNPRLLAHAGVLPPAPSRILVPLCGKTMDMTWLAERGHQVVGVELAEQAVREYFSEREIEPNVEIAGPFRRYAGGGVQLFQGDFFASSELSVGAVDAVYDRASLVALPPEMRRRYARHLTGLLPSGAVYLLLVFVYPQEERNGPPFSIDRAEVDQLFGEQFIIDSLREEPSDSIVGSALLSQLNIVSYKLIKR